MGEAAEAPCSQLALLSTLSTRGTVNGPEGGHTGHRYPSRRAKLSSCLTTEPAKLVCRCSAVCAVPSAGASPPCRCPALHPASAEGPLPGISTPCVLPADSSRDRATSEGLPPACRPHEDRAHFTELPQHLAQRPAGGRPHQCPECSGSHRGSRRSPRHQAGAAGGPRRPQGPSREPVQSASSGGGRTWAARQ